MSIDRDNPRDAAGTGINPGNKLSTTQPNSSPLCTAESAPVQPEPSGWGPGGRRFKSCLPDLAKALLKRGFRRSRLRRSKAHGDKTGTIFCSKGGRVSAARVFLGQ